MDLANMKSDEFIAYMKRMINDFEVTVANDENYDFARNGETLALGDWFEQFAVGSGLM